MIKNIFIILIILILNSCSFDTRSGIWTEEPINLGNEENKEIKVLFKKEILNENEFNPNLKLEIKNFNQNKNKFNGNNFGALEISSSFENISKFSPGIRNPTKYANSFNIVHVIRLYDGYSSSWSSKTSISCQESTFNWTTGRPPALISISEKTFSKWVLKPRVYLIAWF